jgi:hypothetical protein
MVDFNRLREQSERIRNTKNMNLKPTKDLSSVPQYPMMAEGWNKVTPVPGFKQEAPFAIVDGQYGIQVVTAWKDEDGVTVSDYIDTRAEWRFKQIEDALDIQRTKTTTLEKWCNYMANYEESEDEPFEIMAKIHTSVNKNGKTIQKVVAYAKPGSEDEIDELMAEQAAAKSKKSDAIGDDDFDFGENAKKKSDDSGMKKKSSGTATKKGSGKKDIEF